MADDPIVIQTPTAGTEPVPVPAVEESTPPWGDAENFDPAKAWALIQNLRADKAKLGAQLAEAVNLETEASDEDSRSAQDEPAKTEDPVPASEPAAKEPAEDQNNERALALEAENTSLRMELAKTKALASTDLPSWAVDFLPDGTDEEIGAAVTKLLELRGSAAASSGLPPANPAQAAGNPASPTKDDAAREFFSGLGLN